MVVDKITYNGKEKITEPKEFKNWDEVVFDMQWDFDKDPNVAQLDQYKLADGRSSIALKDRSGRIIVKYMTKNPQV